ncbi:uncharacterized protein CEXT_526371 [Caerostris extrusa]|uniref:Uncharacterized protein n=1 Tax=Caerostris extrusa TaxID=172846 RepID=A0AAV4UUW2_CAEEX|nr:uncharacterized protein CEXT_526371 [Caerostris extrusa]
MGDGGRGSHSPILGVIRGGTVHHNPVLGHSSHAGSASTLCPASLHDGALCLQCGPFCNSQFQFECLNKSLIMMKGKADVVEAGIIHDIAVDHNKLCELVFEADRLFNASVFIWFAFVLLVICVEVNSFLRQRERSDFQWWHCHHGVGFLVRHRDCDLHRDRWLPCGRSGFADYSLHREFRSFQRDAQPERVQRGATYHQSSHGVSGDFHSRKVLLHNQKYPDNACERTVHLHHRSGTNESPVMESLNSGS